jgi:nitrogen regulatory protein P-II 1
MKKIEAIVRKSKFKEVKRALVDGGFTAFNYHLTRCISANSEKRFYRGTEFDTKSEDRVLLSVYVNDKNIDAALDIIKNASETGDADDSYLMVFNAYKAYKLEGEDGGDRLIEIF